MMESIIRPMAPPVDGQIRPGIKILTKKARANAEARHIYEKGARGGISFEEIEQEIVASTGIENPLTPKNLPFFVARGFKNPDVVNALMEMYGEDRDGDGKRRLWRVPVMFVYEDPYQIVPHSLSCYARNERRYWSVIDDGVRYCMQHSKVPVSEKTGRAVRLFGGRTSEIRKKCVPEECNEYQSKQCNLSGKIVYYIPGIPGAGLIETPLTSFYGMSACISQLMLTKPLRGRLSGLGPKGEPLFWLAKESKKVAMIKEDGSVVRVAQQIVSLESNLVTSNLLLENSQRAQEAASALGLDHNDIDAASAAAASTPDVSGAASHLSDLLAAIKDACGTANIAFDSYERYAQLKWGAGWKDNESALNEIMIELDECMIDPSYHEEVEACL